MGPHRYALFRSEIERSLRRFRRPKANALQFEHANLRRRAAGRGEAADFTAGGQDSVTWNYQRRDCWLSLGADIRRLVPAPTSFTARRPGPDLCGLSMRLRVMPAAIFAQSACEQGKTGVRREAGEEYEVEVLFDTVSRTHRPRAVRRRSRGRGRSVGRGRHRPAIEPRKTRHPRAVAHPVRRASDPRT